MIIIIMTILVMVIIIVIVIIIIITVIISMVSFSFFNFSSRGIRVQRAAFYDMLLRPVMMKPLSRAVSLQSKTHTHTHTGGFLMKTCLILFLETVVKGKTTLTLGGGGFFKRRAAAKRRRRLTKGMRANWKNGKEGGGWGGD